jgi:hypothetical protein
MTQSKIGEVHFIAGYNTLWGRNASKGKKPGSGLYRVRCNRKWVAWFLKKEYIEQKECTMSHCCSREKILIFQTDKDSLLIPIFCVV